jgi:hypothetical protein
MDPAKKRMALYSAGAVVLLAYLYWPESDSFEDPSQTQSGFLSSLSSLFGSVEEPIGLTGAELPPGAPPPAPPLPPTPAPSDLTGAEQLDFEKVFSEDTEPILEVPYLVNEPVWLALENIETWYADPRSVDAESLISYLKHRKLWVRLTALHFVLSTKVHEESWLEPVRRQLLRDEHPSQARRFLQRVGSYDPETYFRIRTYLKL